MEYDAVQFLGAAPYYLRGRPPYSAELSTTLAEELGLDGAGRLLDVGSGPGTLGVRLAPLFAHTALLEPDADMLAEAKRHAREAGLTAVEFIHATAEDIPDLGLPPMRAVTFGQSFHRTDRMRVAEAVYEVLEPGGSIVLVSHNARRPPRSRPHRLPPIPHDEIDRLITAFLGAERRSGSRPAASYVGERDEATLARSRFRTVRTIHAVGRTDIVRDVDSVIANYLSMSFCAPHLFGSRLSDFTAAVSDVLIRVSPDGQFWDWPGDTEILIATRSVGMVY